MNVLITGGNGFVGRHLVAALQERGDSVAVLALPAEDCTWLTERGVKVRRGDIREPATLTGAVEDVHGVVHLAAMMDVWRSLEDYRAVNVAGTANVCRAAHAAGVRRLVHMSSSSIYGVGAGHIVDEGAPLAPFRDPYPITKAEADRLVARLIREQELPAVIIRPDQIFGPGDHLHFGRMARRIAAGRGVIVGAGENAVPFIYVSDVVQGLLLALDDPRALGQAYNITNDRPLTQREFLAAIADELSVAPPRLHVPYRALYAAGYAAERLAQAASGRRRPPITRLGVAFFGTENRFSIEKARRELGFEPRVGLREGIRRASAWHLGRNTDGEAEGATARQELVR